MLEYLLLRKLELRTLCLLPSPSFVLYSLSGVSGGLYGSSWIYGASLNKRNSTNSMETLMSKCTPKNLKYIIAMKK